MPPQLDNLSSLTGLEKPGMKKAAVEKEISNLVSSRSQEPTFSILFNLVGIWTNFVFLKSTMCVHQKNAVVLKKKSPTFFSRV